MSRRARTTASAVVVGAGAAGYWAARMRRSRRLHHLAEGLHDTLLVPESGTGDDAGDVVAHAPGHRHLGPPPRVAVGASAPRHEPRGDRRGRPGRFF